MPEALQPFRRVRDILAFVMDLHLRRISEYEQAMRGNGDVRLRAVLAYIRDNDRRVVAAIARIAEDENALDAFVQGVPIAALSAAQESCSPDSGIETILYDYGVRDHALGQLYEQLRASPLGPRAKAIFDDLGQLALHNQQRLRQAMLDFEGGA
ncbi:MAG TPA: hypothetical protein VFZ65_05990 [Planctomycetota bacterium]|nr:hypothetical protein [Planctomycetota bacterium]